MNSDTLRTIEGLHTEETLMKALAIKRQSVKNLLTKLKKEHHMTVWAKGKKRIYKITIAKQRPRSLGMFDILNKYNPNFQLQPWYDHQVHGEYTVEDAIVDAVKTKSFRVLLSTLKLYNHVTNWVTLYHLAKKNNCWNQVGALYDVARLHERVRHIPKRYRPNTSEKKHFLLQRNYPTSNKQYKPIEKKWNVPIPFLEGDIKKVITL